VSDNLPTAVIIRLSALGDLLLTAAFTQKLARTHRVLFVTGPAYQNIAALLPGVHTVFCLDKKATPTEKNALVEQLNRASPTVLFDLQNKFRTILFRRQIQAKRSVALSKRTWAQGLMALIGHDTVLNDTHQSHRYLQVLNEPPSPQGQHPSLSEVPQEWVAHITTEFEKAIRVPGKPVVGLAFGATHPTKGWPLAHLVQLIRLLNDEVNWVLVGGPNDVERARRIGNVLEGNAPCDTCHLSIEGLTGVVSQLQGMVGVDTGPMHLARLLNVPTLTLFGPTSINRWGPGPFASNRHRALSLDLPCQPCTNHGGTLCPLDHHACMKDLLPEEVANQTRSLLGDLP
jgi:heptosyltransferase-2